MRPCVHPVPWGVPNPRPDGWRKNCHAGEPGSEPVHYRPRLAVRRRDLAGVHGRGLLRDAPPSPACGGSDLKRSLLLYAAWAYAFLYLPLIVLGAFSFNASRIANWTGFTWQWYQQVFGDVLLWEGTVNSLVIAGATTVISTVLGTLGAYSLWKAKAPVLTSSLYLSLVTPE